MSESGWAGRWALASLLALSSVQLWAAEVAVQGSAEVQATVAISNAVLIQPPPGAPVIGGYLRMRSTGGDRLLDVSGQISADIQMHSMAEQDGKMIMRRLPDIELPAGQEVVLDRGGLHLMIIDPLRRPEVGERVQLNMQFEQAGTLRVEFLVQDGRTSAADGDSIDESDEHAHHHDHHH